MLAGIAIAIAATVAGIASTGVSPGYFFQPTGALIVIGGTLGVTFITTPRVALLHSLRRVGDLFLPARLSREELIEEIVKGRTELEITEHTVGIDFLARDRAGARPDEQ